jgi:hypothetical protein
MADVVELVVAGRGGVVVGGRGTETVATVVGDGLARGAGAAGLAGAGFAAKDVPGPAFWATDNDGVSAVGSATTADTSPTNGWSTRPTSIPESVASEGVSGAITTGAVEVVGSDDEVIRMMAGDESAALDANGRPTPRTPGTPRNDATMANAKSVAMLPTPRASQVTAVRRPPWLATKIGSRPELT